MDNFRSALNAARQLPDPQAEDALHGLLAQNPELAPAEEGTLRYTLGIILLRQEKNTEARRELEQACRLLEKSPGAETALAMTALARIQLVCGELEQSLSTDRNAHRLLQEHLSPDDPRMAPSLFSLSLTEYTARQLPEAEKLTTEAKRLWEKQLGPDSLEVSTCLNNLGRIHEETDRQEEGIAYHRAALNIRRKVLGDHPETAFFMGNLGTALAAAGKWQDAADTLQAAIDCYARCGHTSGGDIEGYRRNLDICRSALALEKP